MALRRIFPVLFVFAAAAIGFATHVQAQEQIFHKGDKVIATPYGGEWWYCTVASERVGNPPANFSYQVVCDPWGRTPGEKPPQQSHLYSAERIKAVDDPQAVAGIENMRRMFPAGDPNPPAQAPRAPQAQNQAPAPRAAANSPAPQQAAPKTAAVPGQYKVGDRVAMPAGFGGKFYEAVIVAIDPAYNPQPFLVHPLGYLDTMNTHFSAQQLPPAGSVKTEPVGHIANDPYLLAAQGKKAFQPTQLFAGRYECVTYTGGQLVSAAILDFTVIDNHTYRDISGVVGQYQFDQTSGTVAFQSGSLGGHRAKYTQASNPPQKTQPPQVVLDGSGDNCELSM